MRDLVFQVVRETESFVVSMGTLEWTLAFALVVGFGIFCMQGVGSKTRG